MPSYLKSSIRSGSAGSTASCSTSAYLPTSWPTPRAGSAFKVVLGPTAHSTCDSIRPLGRRLLNFSQHLARPNWPNSLSSLEKTAPAERSHVPSSPGVPNSPNGRPPILWQPSPSRCRAGQRDVRKSTQRHGSFRPYGLPSITNSNISNSFWQARWLTGFTPAVAR
jgi:hypothetical protein